MELALEFIQSMKVKLISEQKGTLKAIEQVSEEDITWHPTPESNSIANLVAHIRGLPTHGSRRSCITFRTIGTGIRNSNVD